MLNYKLSFAVPITVIIVILLMSWRVYSYVEIHYTFFRYSIINQGYPEILVDAPFRVNPGEPVPIVCIVKDADKFPIKIKQIVAHYFFEGGEKQKITILDENQSVRIDEHYWYMISYLNPPENQYGFLKINVEIDAIRNGFKKTIYNDNFPGLSHSPFKVLVSPYELPKFHGWHAGDPHYHSDMTQDQVEFGAPVEVAAIMGKSLGLKWLVASDHSYDLDVAINEFFQHDSKLPRWNKIREDSNLVNAKNDGFLVIPAEEVSCGNHKKHNIHLLAFGVPNFIPGKGDGVKRGLNRRPDLSLRQCLNRIANAGGFAYAAHPEEGNGYLGTLMLNRDHWRDKDYAQGGYVGLQFWNGTQGKEFNRAYKKWIELILEGRRLYIIGGNDAHGDFNRCRKIKYPNTRLSEDYEHVFGKIRTYANCGDNFSADGILDALKNGKAVVSNGPLAIMQVRNNDSGQIADVGGDIIGKDLTLNIKACSSEEFGPIEKINLYYGNLTTGSEEVEKTFVPENSNGYNNYYYDYKLTYDLVDRSKGYFRIEAISKKNGKEYNCFSNPIWIRQT